MVILPLQTLCRNGNSYTPGTPFPFRKSSEKRSHFSSPTRAEPPKQRQALRPRFSSRKAKVPRDLFTPSYRLLELHTKLRTPCRQQSLCWATQGFRILSAKNKCISHLDRWQETQRLHTPKSADLNAVLYK